MSGSGALFQLAAKGKEDIKLYKNVSDNFAPFKAVYKGYSNFSMEDHIVPFGSISNKSILQHWVMMSKKSEEIHFFCLF